MNQPHESTEPPANEGHGDQVPPSVDAKPNELGLSVIVPVRNSPEFLDECLNALSASEHPNFEIIVVDDASTDDTPEVARRHGVPLIDLEEHAGPAEARNRGAEIAQHPYLFFIDADVCVGPEVLGQVAGTFASDDTIDALFGSYDTSPAAPNAVSQYRNLLHHWVHQTSVREASSFWTGCGAIKRSVFFSVSGLDADYDNACIEDIELGARLRRSGYRTVLMPSIQVKHLKRWNMSSMIQVDIFRRGIPWTQLLLREGSIPNELNLRYSQRLSAVLALGFVVTWMIETWYAPVLLVTPIVILATIAAVDRWTDYRPQSAGPWLLAAVALTGALGAPLAVAAGVHESLIRGSSIVGFVCLLGVACLNFRFYFFLARVKHPAFLLLAFPLHLLYFLYSTLAFGFATLQHLAQKVLSPTATPSPEKEIR